MTETVSHLLVLDFAGSALSEMTIISLHILNLSFLLCYLKYNHIQWEPKAWNHTENVLCILFKNVMCKIVNKRYVGNEK